MKNRLVNTFSRSVRSVRAHVLALGARLDQILSGPLAMTVWFYVGASAALLADTGLGVLLAAGVVLPDWANEGAAPPMIGVLLAGGALGSAPFTAHPTLTASIEMEPPSTPCNGWLRLDPTDMNIPHAPRSWDSWRRWWP